ncbi:MAG: hypothetical protein ACRYFZ_15150 [Janthinobacterium lividum]
MREVKYVRWKAWISVAFGLAIAGVGLAACWEFNKLPLGAAVTLFGAVMVHVARLRLVESDVLLRLTPDKIWTKEFGWQPWGSLVVDLDINHRESSLEIHRPNEFTPRFREDIAKLDISPAELRHWVTRYAGQQ